MRDHIIVGGVILSSYLALVACSPALSTHPAVGAELSADISFTCDWWSEAQMNGLNPNAPPPKNTEVKLTKWEYSDPVGVPHPDVFNVVVRLTNKGPRELSDIKVEIAGQWKVGPLRDEGQARWLSRTALKDSQDLHLQPGATQILRVPVDLKMTMGELEKRQEWPYALRATVTARSPGVTKPLAQVQADLPIRPGD